MDIVCWIIHYPRWQIPVHLLYYQLINYTGFNVFKGGKWTQQTCAGAHVPADTAISLKQIYYLIYHWEKMVLALNLVYIVSSNTNGVILIG